MDPETAIRFARIFHRFVPLAQLRSAACIGHMLNGAPLTLEMRLYGYRMSVDLHRSAAYRLLFIEGERWIEDAPAIQRSVRAGMTVFDIGANIGYLSLLMSRLVGISGRVYAFEPDADNYASLKRAVEDNQIRQCIPLNLAVGDRNQVVNFSGGENGFVDGNASTAVSMTTLDEFVDQNGICTVDFVKIDVEGFEGRVLDGMQRVIGDLHPRLHVEIHPAGFCGAGDPAGVAQRLQRQYGCVDLFLCRSALSRRKRLMASFSARFFGQELATPVTPRYLCSHPEQRYFALCHA